jgi:hypothetical protein
MEQENQTIEQVNEPTEKVVSNEQVQAQTEEFKAPSSKEELEQLTQAAINRAKTEMLKDLGVKSVKEFKDFKNEIETKYTQYDSLLKEKDEYASKYESLVNENITLKRQQVLNKLNIQDEYKEDLTKLALDHVSESKNFEQVLTEMVNSKYKYAVTGTSQIKMGTSKTETQPNQTYSPEVLKRMPWLKN